MPQVVQDASAIGHAAAGDDDRTALDAVDRHRFPGRDRGVQVRQAERIRRAAPDVPCLGVEQFVVAVVHLQHPVRHRAVEEHPPARHLPFVPEAREPVQQLLRTPDRERRDQHVAAVVPCPFEDAAEFGNRFRAIPVVAVAVGRFHQDEIGIAHGFRIAQDRSFLRTEVAGEHQLLPVGPQLDDARAEDVAGIAERDVDPGEDGGTRVVAQRTHLRHRILDVVARVQRQGFWFSRLALSIGALGVVFRQRGGVEQHDRHQLGGGLLGEDRAAETARHQLRDAADVVDVRVAGHQRIDRLGIEREGFEVRRLHLAAALLHAAIEQDALAGGLDQVHGSGHLPGGAVEMDAHRALRCGSRRT